MRNIFELKNISVDYKLKNYSIRAVNNVNFNIVEGKITALVGESGSGKTTIASSLLQCISSPGEVVAGNILYYHYDYSNKSVGNNNVTDITLLNKTELNKYRWKEVSMVFQSAQSALNPVMNIYDQFLETIKAHTDKKINNKELKKLAIEKSKKVLDYVNLDYERVLKMYPHELSGGMKQRVMIAFSLLLDPKLIILDEPTTALDVITQDYIFKILYKINREKGITMLLLTHDIGVVAKFADYVAVMYAGKIMEYGTTREVFKLKKHPYSTGLINATPSINKDINNMKAIKGSPPNLMKLPSGCVFHPRCEECMEICKNHIPEIMEISEGHFVNCNKYSKGKL
jgi:peptide/nickel transport system ATP-binding protein